MNDDQITALAREYAEIECPEFKYKGDKEWRNDDIKSATLSNAAFLTWLLRRYCLVEKDKICEAYKDAQKDQHNSEGDFALTLAGRNRSSVLIDLFPEIAKEVES